jgi:hypothetical protein
MEATVAKRVTFDEWECICRRELRELYDCLYETDAERRKTPYGPWAQSKFATADKSRLNASNGHAEEQDSHPQRELASGGRKGAKKRQKNEDEKEGHAPRSAWR